MEKTKDKRKLGELQAKSERNNVNCLIKRTKIDYYKRKIQAGTDMGKLYFFLNTLIGGMNKKLLGLPESVSDARLANITSAFFENKIISAHIESNNEAISHLLDIPYCKLDKFKEVTLPDTKDILSKAKNCERDPFPIGDIKEQRNIDRLTGVIIHKITNLSLENG